MNVIFATILTGLFVALPLLILFKKDKWDNRFTYLYFIYLAEFFFFYALAELFDCEIIFFILFGVSWFYIPFLFIGAFVVTIYWAIKERWYKEEED
jgi:surface polysaccharide O-acyltransferase-like enzyme